MIQLIQNKHQMYERTLNHPYQPLDSELHQSIHLMNKKLTGVFDLGTGKSHKLKDITDHLGLYPKLKIGDKHERTDNQADISKLRKSGWKPTLDIFEYFNERGLQKNA